MANAQIHNAADLNSNQLSKLNNNLSFLRQLPGGYASQEVTIASGSITPSLSAIQLVRSEGGASTDTLTNIVTTNFPDGSVILLIAGSASETITISNAAGGAGQLNFNVGQFSRELSTDHAVAFRRSGSDWYETPVSIENHANLNLKDGLLVSGSSSANMSVSKGGIPGGGINIGSGSALDSDDLNLISNGTGKSITFLTGLINPSFRISDVSSSVNYLKVNGAVTTANPLIESQGTDTNIGLDVSSKGTGDISFYTNTNSDEQFKIAHTASSVNFVEVSGAAAGVGPEISASGADVDVNLIYSAKNAGSHIFIRNSAAQFQISGPIGAVNRVLAQGAVTGSSPAFISTGTDTDIDLTLSPKGTGVIRFGTHASIGAETVTGYITIKDSGGTSRKLAVVS